MRTIFVKFGKKINEQFNNHIAYDFFYTLSFEFTCI